MADLGAGPPLPPEVMAQQSPHARSPIFMQPRTATGGDPIAALEGKIAELERWATDMYQQLEFLDPPSQALLVPVAQAGKALQSRIQQLRQRMGGAPTTPGPTARPTPAEGAPVRPMI